MDKGHRKAEKPSLYIPWNNFQPEKNIMLGPRIEFGTFLGEQGDWGTTGMPFEVKNSVLERAV